MTSLSFTQPFTLIVKRTDGTVTRERVLGRTEAIAALRATEWDDEIVGAKLVEPTGETHATTARFEGDQEDILSL